VRWEGLVARVGDRRGDTGLWLGNLRERDNFEDLSKVGG
jgi:hypothetical protein